MGLAYRMLLCTRIHMICVMRDWGRNRVDLLILIIIIKIEAFTMHTYEHLWVRFCAFTRINTNFSSSLEYIWIDILINYYYWSSDSFYDALISSSDKIDMSLFTLEIFWNFIALSQFQTKNRYIRWNRYKTDSNEQRNKYSIERQTCFDLA